MSFDRSCAPCALVVDDDPLIRMGAIDILEEAGFRVLDADHGDAALDLLEVQHEDITLLFTDVQMPGKFDGFALARHVATHWPHISIVVASGHAAPGPGSMPAKSRFISKPFSAEVVYAHIRKVLPNNVFPTITLRS